MEKNKIELIVKAIRKECSRYSLIEWCKGWGFSVEDFDEFLEYAERVIEIEKKKSYNQALEDFANTLLDGEQSEEFIYSIKEIIERLRK